MWIRVCWRVSGEFGMPSVSSFFAGTVKRHVGSLIQMHCIWEVISAYPFLFSAHCKFLSSISIYIYISYISTLSLVGSKVVLSYYTSETYR